MTVVDASHGTPLTDRSAVLIVDMQNDFCSDEGTVASRGADVSATQRVAARLPRFVDEARARGALIVWVRQVSSDPFVSDARRARSAALGWSATDIAREGSWGAELFDGLVMADGDVDLVKRKYSAFVGTPLTQLLRARNKDTVIVCGTATNVCVDSTVRSAYMEEFHVVVPTDLVSASNAELGEAALRTLGIYFCDLTTSAELLAAG